ncbi:MAG: phosphotransferase [Burkholderiaceae bacterium]|jgi:aminoglycoside/choline kinase family phosphotransferase|nr:phosphotransferase [Burkholderiaceae bacterium]
MSDTANTAITPTDSAIVGAAAAVVWSDPQREAAFVRWLADVAPAHGLVAASLRPASADASFRRYLRVDADDGTTRIVMDAPPTHENCAAFVHVAALMRDAGLNVPRILEFDPAQGFMLLTDLGTRTMMDVIDPARPEANRPLYLQAVDALLQWQQASRGGQLPPYDEALLRRELALFPDWYLARHRGVAVDGALRRTLEQTFDLIVARNLAAPKVYVHRDFMPRNLMAPPERAAAGGSSADAQGIGVLDFQDAVHGPVTYDIASLMRDAFLSWDEPFVLDITIRYWERARQLGLLDFEDWASDFASFWRALEWMGLQRHLKVAGIFARLTLRDGKPKYLADAPRFIGYIRHTAARYRELMPLLRLLDEVER